MIVKSKVFLNEINFLEDFDFLFWDLVKMFLLIKLFIWVVRFWFVFFVEICNIFFVFVNVFYLLLCSLFKVVSVVVVNWIMFLFFSKEELFWVRVFIISFKFDLVVDFGRVLIFIDIFFFRNVFWSYFLISIVLFFIRLFNMVFK